MLSEEREAVREALEWRKVKGLFHHDARYRAIDSSTQKEELFKEFVKSLGRVGITSDLVVVRIVVSGAVCGPCLRMSDRRGSRPA